MNPVLNIADLGAVRSGREGCFAASSSSVSPHRVELCTSFRLGGKDCFHWQRTQQRNNSIFSIFSTYLCGPVSGTYWFSNLYSNIREPASCFFGVFLFCLFVLVLVKDQVRTCKIRNSVYIVIQPFIGLNFGFVRNLRPVTKGDIRISARTALDSLCPSAGNLSPVCIFQCS